MTLHAPPDCVGGPVERGPVERGPVVLRYGASPLFAPRFALLMTVAVTDLIHSVCYFGLNAAASPECESDNTPVPVVFGADPGGSGTTTGTETGDGSRIQDQ